MKINKNKFLLTKPAFVNFYKICKLLHHSKRNILAKNRLKKSAIFVKFQQIFANVAKSAK